MAEKHLLVLMNDRHIGNIKQSNDALSFTYSDHWRSTPGAYPLSTAMPLNGRIYGNAQVSGFLWGLLPDNETVLQRWAKRFQVSSRNPFALLSHVGEDCAGAAQFVTPDRLEALTESGVADNIEWRTEKEVADLLRPLVQDAGTGRLAKDTGQFSLAGAQPKTALYFDGHRWGVPQGRMPTTHILKPPTGAYDGLAHNEHFCLNLARRLGMLAAPSTVMKFEDQVTIVVERFDRIAVSEMITQNRKRLDELDRKPKDSKRVQSILSTSIQEEERTRLQDEIKTLQAKQNLSVLRIHQEDFCQALMERPENKYQNAGGPSPEKIIERLRLLTPNRTDAERDVRRFVDALIFNWLIGGTDAHGKNYGLLIGTNARVRLAPLYDVASILCYSDIDPRKAKLAMKIGDEYLIEKVTGAEWLKFAIWNNIERDYILSRLRDLAAALPDHAATEITSMQSAGIDHPILEKLGRILTERSRRIARSIA
jgi:serine/threonine-protein kinase HipA